MISGGQQGPGVRQTIYSLAKPIPEIQGGSFSVRPCSRLSSVKTAWWPQRPRTRLERGTGNERLASALSWLIGGIGSL
jgi:hypothetical protein